jgi:GH18 family chitinase
MKGWNHGTTPFSNMVRNNEKRKLFIETTIVYLKKHNFDGLG